MRRRSRGEEASRLRALQLRELEIERLLGLAAALSEINHTIFRCATREEIFRRVCDVLVDSAGFPYVRIGWNDIASAQMVPAAERGNDDGRTTSTDSTSHASVSVPITLLGDVAGVLTVHASEADFFQDREVGLLTAAAADISFALDNLEREADRRGAQEAALVERTFSDAMIDSLPGVLYLYDEKGTFLRWSQSFQAATGYAADEIGTMHPLDVFPADERIRVGERIAEVFEHGASQVEAVLLSRDGTTTPYFWTGRRVVFDGRVCCVGVGIDISERIEAELALTRSEQRYRSTLDGVLEACQIIGFDWTYLYLNPAAAVQNQRPNDELLGRRMQDIWPGIEDTAVFALIKDCMEHRTAGHHEVEFAFPNGDVGWFDVRAQPVPEGTFVLSVDITERRRAETALRELNETLEHRIVERTDALRTALLQAEAADRVKSAFLATMSHELRTPLNSIIGFTGLLLQQLAGPLNPEQTKQLTMVRGSARHLLELINDVLDLSKIEAGQLEVSSEPVELGPMVERIVALIKPLADEKGLALVAGVAPDLPVITSDRRRLEQILLNLANNAIKFTESGTVRLDAGMGAAASTTVPQPAVHVSVTDSGIGIEPDDLSSLFKPFRQIDSGLTRQHDGTGLGLVICRGLAGLLGGEITVTSEFGRGSTFTLTLPVGVPTS